MRTSKTVNKLHNLKQKHLMTSYVTSNIIVILDKKRRVEVMFCYKIVLFHPR